MSLESVKDEILSGAKIEANSIVGDAKREAQRIASDAEKKLADFKEKSEAETQKIIESIQKQEMASVELEAKKLLLEVKKQIVEDVFENANKEIASMDKKKKEAILAKILARVKKEIDAGKIYCNKKDAPLIEDRSEHVDIMGGILAENKEKTIRLDYSFESTLQNIRETQMQHISKKLF